MNWTNFDELFSLRWQFFFIISDVKTARISRLIMRLQKTNDSALGSVWLYIMIAQGEIEFREKLKFRLNGDFFCDD